MKGQKATNVVWHEHKVTREEREFFLKQKGVVLWLTGLSGSGKSTIANEVAYELHKMGKLAYVLDGDNIRHGLNKDLGFSPDDRNENIRRISEVAKLFADSGINAPYEEPENPELVLDTNKETVEESAEKVLAILKKQKIIST